MGGGKTRQRQNAWAPKGKGMGTYQPMRAVAMAETYHIGALRPYPSEDGGIFVRRQGAARDADMVSLEGIAQRLHAQNHEACNRPGVWLSTLAASLRHGLKIVEYGEMEPEKTGRAQVAATVEPELLEALAALDHTQRRQADEAETTEALLHALKYVCAEELVEPFQRLALYGGGVYLAAMQYLEAGARGRHKREFEPVGSMGSELFFVRSHLVGAVRLRRCSAIAAHGPRSSRSSWRTCRAAGAGSCRTPTTTKPSWTPCRRLCGSATLPSRPATC